MGKVRWRSRLAVTAGVTVLGAVVTALTQSGTLTPGWSAALVSGVGGLVGGALGFAGSVGWSRVEQRRSAARTAIEERATVFAVLPAVLPPELAADARPSSLLLDDRALAPFRGRRRELEGLVSWCTDSAKPVLGVLTGPPLVGKTRLTIAPAERLAGEWTVGRLRDGAGAEAVRKIAACPGNHLVVVETTKWRPELPKLLDELVANPDRNRLKALLVCRNTTVLSRLHSEVGELAAASLSQAEAFEVAPHGSADDLLRWHNEAAAAFAAHLRRPRPASGGGGIAAGTPIGEVQARALASVLLMPAAPDARVGERQVVDVLVDHEIRQWSDPAGVPVSRGLRRRVVAAGLLLDARDRTDAVRTLSRLPELADATQERLCDLADWVASLYPGAERPVRGGRPPAERGR